jgi:hypothetical protein
MRRVALPKAAGLLILIVMTTFGSCRAVAQESCANLVNQLQVLRSSGGAGSSWETFITGRMQDLGCFGQQSQPTSACPAGHEECGDYCCGSGNYCSRYGCIARDSIECGNHYCGPGQQCSRSGGCQPAGVVDCGDYYCPSGQRCASGHRACLAMTDIDCGSYSCRSGYFCGSKNSCIGESSKDCGNGTSCPYGRKCSRDGKSCLAEDAVDCGNHSCSAGYTCGSYNTCIAKNATDCGNGTSCPAGRKCSRDAKSCLEQDAVDCGSFVCRSDRKCGSGNQCLAKEETDCGNGTSCGPGHKCRPGGVCMPINAIACGKTAYCDAGLVCVEGKECLTKADVAKRAEEEKARKKEAIAAEQAKKAAIQQAAKEAKEKVIADAKQKALEKQQQAARKCISNADFIKSVADGQQSKLPLCSEDKTTPAQGVSPSPAAAPGTVPTAADQLILNPNLKDAKTLSPAAPAPTVQQPNSVGSPNLGVCSTFETRDPTLAAGGCPTPSIASTPTIVKPAEKVDTNDDLGPFAPRTPAQKQSDEAAEIQRLLDPKLVVGRVPIGTREEEDCGGMLGEITRREVCEKKDGSFGYGRRCIITKKENLCDLHQNGSKDHCEWTIAATTEICK